MTTPLPKDDLQQAVEWLRAAQRVVVFSGAGLSAASGIATFRDADGFWNRFPPEEFANWKGLLQTAVLQPKRFADFLIAVLQPIAEATPNAAHLAIAELQQHTTVDVITQNIDRLHQAAGSHSVFEIHGSLFEIVEYPPNEAQREVSREELNEIVAKIESARRDFLTSPGLLKAVGPLLGMSTAGIHRPRLVLFGDDMAEPDWADARQAVSRCDLLISVGTSQSVYPAATLPEVAREHGVKVIVIDPATGGGDCWLAATAESCLPELIAAAFPEEVA